MMEQHREDDDEDDWSGSAPTKHELINALVGRDDALDLVPQWMMPTSLRATRIELDKRGGYRYQNAAYDKILIISGDAAGGERLEYGLQQIMSAARAMMDPEQEPAGESPMVASESPILPIARTLSSSVRVLLRGHPTANRSREEVAKEILKIARRISDHDGVIAEITVEANEQRRDSELPELVGTAPARAKG